MTTPTLDPTRLVEPGLSRKQIRSIVEALDTPQLALWSGAVRSGKTIASLIAFIIALVDASDRGIVVIIGRTLQTIERNILEPLQSPHLFGPIAHQVHHTTGATTATIMGRRVHLIGANDVKAEGRIRGSTISLAYVDEATLVPRSVWMMLLSRLSTIGAKLLATTNPDMPAHWLRKDFILRAGEVDLRWWHFTLDDNPSLDPAYVERLKRQYVGLWYRRFILGLWIAAEGAIYAMWDEAQHVSADAPVMRQWLALGVDYGTVNPFAALLIGLGTDGRLWVTDEWWYDSKIRQRPMTDGEYSRSLVGFLDGVTVPGTGSAGEKPVRGVRPQWVCVDPSAASFVVQLHRDGHFTPTPARNAVVDGIRTVATLLGQDKLRVHPRCQNLINEIPGYSWDDEQAAKGIDKPIKADDHALDALRYAIYTTEAAWRPHVADLPDLLPDPTSHGRR